MKTVDAIDFNNKTVVVRVDFNVPLNDKFEITDDTRIQSALPTLQKILNDGGSVVLLSHLGRPKGSPSKEFSLQHIVPQLKQMLGVDVKFVDDAISDEAFEQSANLKSGEVLLLENLRFHVEEKEGDSQFAEQLSRHGNVYVNDAFGTAHRAHASTSKIAENFSAENKAFGYLMAQEVDHAAKLLNNPKRPFVAITGGAKVSDKIAILDNLIGKADHIIIGGGMAYTFIKAQGGLVGDSLVEEDRVQMASDLLQKANQAGTTIHLPVDSIVADDFAKDAETQIEQTNQISSGWMGLDIGPMAIEAFTAIILSAESILWNGPMGVFEFEAFSKGTRAIAAAVAQATQNGAYSLIGGGDSAAAVNQFGFGEQVSHISTGGGALLELFEGKELPGIAAMK